MDNLTNVAGTDGAFLNDTQLTGTENVTLVTNFAIKPVVPAAFSLLKKNTLLVLKINK
ncbi:MAG: hypothetical protein L0H53_13420 [Candidatus Nitrosocosmicus sp.]|nr:hypothetical protein [Candidatus Nitrosocosmicus sp.]